MNVCMSVLLRVSYPFIKLPLYMGAFNYSLKQKNFKSSGRVGYSFYRTVDACCCALRSWTFVLYIFVNNLAGLKKKKFLNTFIRFRVFPNFLRTNLKIWWNDIYIYIVPTLFVKLSIRCILHKKKKKTINLLVYYTVKPR